MNKAAENFSKNLRAAVESWSMPTETYELYKSKLSHWNLTEAQWASAFDRLMDGNQDRKLPALSAIYTELEYQRRAARNENNRGFAHFDMPDGHHYVVRIMSENGEWLYAYASRKNAQGQKVELYGEKAGTQFYFPIDATNREICPDNPAPESQPTEPIEPNEDWPKEERQKLVNSDE